MSQLKRIKTHRRWLLDPPTVVPRRTDFGLPEKRLIGKDQLGAAESLLEKGCLVTEDLTPNFLAVLDRERRYRSALNEWQQYMGWRKQRNPARSALEARFGHDTKEVLGC